MNRWRVTYPEHYGYDPVYFSRRDQAAHELRMFRWLHPTLSVRVDWWQWAPVANMSGWNTINWGPGLRLISGNHAEAFVPRGPCAWWSDFYWFVLMRAWYWARGFLL